jgi:hypothetical protein
MLNRNRSIQQSALPTKDLVLRMADSSHSNVPVVVHKLKGAEVLKLCAFEGEELLSAE